MTRGHVIREATGRNGPDSSAMTRWSRVLAATEGRTAATRLRCRRTIHRAAVVVTLAAGIMLGAGFATSVARATDRVPLPALVKAHRGEACVEPLPVIRRDHMKFLMHQRDDTVHEGIRGARHSLVGCIDCHAAKDDTGQWVRIDAPGQFCATCHEYVSVKIDCFECHAALPTMAFRGATE